jgi:multiple sugar transport system permease protein
MSAVRAGRERRAGRAPAVRGARHPALLYGAAALVALWCLTPVYWMCVSAFHGPGRTFDTTPWPAHVTLESFRTAFDTGRGNHLGRALLNSTVIAAVTTAVAMVLGVLASYALARLRFRGRTALLGGFLLAAMFPTVALVTPLFQFFSDIHWIGRYRAMIVPDISFALPLAVWLVTGFLTDLPVELEQAAQTDGCTRAQAFRLIVLPLAAPGVFATTVLVFIATWNEYLLASLLSNGRPDVEPVTVAIADFTGAQPHQEPYTAVMAAGVVVTVPLIVLVLLCQRRIVSGLTAGALD